MEQKSLQQIREYRIAKLNRLKELGFDSYPATVQKDVTNNELINQFDKYKDQEFNLCGRARVIRSYGKLLFIDLVDESAKIQIILMSQNEMVDFNEHKKSLKFEEVKELLDEGDFIEVYGILIKSKTGETSIQCKSIRIITKTLRPIPLELNDTEVRQRQRYLDILVHSDVKGRFERRAKFWQATREFMLNNGFIEHYMPILEHTTGGADANPFITHMDAIDQDFYLRISHELPLKRMIGAGYEKVFEIGHRFRNEGFSDEHLPEHMAMEFYYAYTDYEKGMKFIEEMFKYIAQKVWGTLVFEREGVRVDLAQPWEIIEYDKVIYKTFGIDIWNTNLEEVQTKLNSVADNLKVDRSVFKAENINRGIDLLWKQIRKTIMGPAFMIHEPVFMSPLAKTSIKNPKVVERIHPMIFGSELGNGYSELNDPLDQLMRFEVQESLRLAGDSEAQMLDKDFVEMLEYGMPPTFGWGHSERVFWMLEGVSAREGVIFPPMRNK